MNFSQLHRSVAQICLLAAICLVAATARAQDDRSAKSKEIYDQIKAFALSGGSVPVKELQFKRDRVEMTFTGTFYFSAPVEGHVTGAVFVGDGKLNAPAPANEFERDNLKRMIGTSDSVDSDFKTAVLRFSDDTFERLGQNPSPGSADAQTQKLASELDPRILRETGANLAARVALSILNREKPGFFFAQFDGGRRGRFNLLLDYQNRIPVGNFDINGGEKGLFFKYRADDLDNDIWMAFYGQDDYKRGTVEYSDVNDQIDITHYDLNLNLADYKRAIMLRARVKAATRVGNLRAVSFEIGENLGEYESWRLKKQMRLKQARLGAEELAFAQEDWEGGFTVFLSAEVAAGQNLEFTLLLEGDFMYDAETGFSATVTIAFQRNLVSPPWLSRPRDVRYYLSPSEKISYGERRTSFERRGRS
jgi:hypothetical protein